MKKQIYRMAIIGCGDYLRWQAGEIKATKNLEVSLLFDPRQDQARRFAAELGGRVAANEHEIFTDSGIDLVALFVPPWIRRGLVERAAAAGKHIYTTKPLGATVAECEAMAAAVSKSGVLCGLGYNRTANPLVEAYKQVFADPEIGQLALYRQDWIHHYPEWNTWALDPEKNGGPFMDAMIHNQNIARYLMGRPMKAVTFFSDRHAHPELKCGDTEFMKLDFEGNGAAHLFITWAADLAVHSKQGNDREHIDICYMVSEKGWRLTHAWGAEGQVITASRGGVSREWKVKGLAQNAYEQFLAALASGNPLPADIPGIQEALEDIKLIRMAEKNQGVRVPVTF